MRPTQIPSAIPRIPRAPRTGVVFGEPAELLYFPTRPKPVPKPEPAPSPDPGAQALRVAHMAVFDLLSDLRALGTTQPEARASTVAILDAAASMFRHCIADNLTPNNARTAP